MTCVGPVQLERHWWGNRCACTTTGGYHVDGNLGVNGHLSRRLQQKACRLTADLSFALSAEHLQELLGVPLSAETLRTVTEQHGRAMAEWQPKDEAIGETFQAAAGQVEFTVDAGKANTREEGWKDVKIGVLQKRMAGTPVTAEGWDQQRLPTPTVSVAWAAVQTAFIFGKSWRPWLQRVGVTQMAELQVVADGASWIWKLVERMLTGSRQMLDIYHACEHLAHAGQELYGEGTAEAAAFLERSRVSLLTNGWDGVCAVVADEYAHGDTPPRRAALERLVKYFVKHTSRLTYAERLAQGEVIGSGAVEGQAKTIGLRLKARGARWRMKNIRRMATLVCVRHSDQWSHYWISVA